MVTKTKLWFIHSVEWCSVRLVYTTSPSLFIDITHTLLKARNKHVNIGDSLIIPNITQTKFKQQRSHRSAPWLFLNIFNISQTILVKRVHQSTFITNKFFKPISIYSSISMDNQVRHKQNHSVSISLRPVFFYKNKVELVQYLVHCENPRPHIRNSKWLQYICQTNPLSHIIYFFESTDAFM